MTIILGIDPGLHKTGWGIIKLHNNQLSFIKCGVVISDTKQPISNRLKVLNQEITNIINIYNPDECAIEEIFVNKNPLSSLKLGHARGAIMLTIAMANLPIKEFSSTLVKKSVTGTGHADKGQVMSMVKYILPKSEAKSEDAADALAVAICHINHRNIFI